jgi:hypothetical protein
MNLGTPPAAIATALLAEALFTNGSLSWKARVITLTWVYLVARLLTFPVSLMLRANDWWMLVFFIFSFSLAWIILAAILALKSVRRLWIRHT